MAEPDLHKSAWSFRQKVLRTLWMFAQTFLFRTSFHNWYGWRRFLLRLFGATVGQRVRVRPTARIEIPWNLTLADDCTIGDFAILYSLGRITIGQRAIVSQYAHLCAGSHDHTSRKFPLLTPPITIGQDCWIATDAFVGPGVTIGDRTVVGARSTVTRDLPPDVVAVGMPAKPIKPRVLND
jgi:putative colanic acid biosynthesis acetyltransferase WcaF